MHNDDRCNSKSALRPSSLVASRTGGPVVEELDLPAQFPIEGRLVIKSKRAFGADWFGADWVLLDQIQTTCTSTGELPKWTPVLIRNAFFPL